MKKKILLVGGCGFIGHNLALKLLKKGHKPCIVDSLGVNNILSFTDSEINNKDLYRSILNNRINIINEKKIELAIQDCRDYFAINKLYDKINPDIIVHLAAVSHANKSNKDPHSTFDHSLRTLENTLDFAKNKKLHVIYISSSMVYGNFNKGVVNEETRCEPIGIYGNLKLAGELMVKSYNQVFDLPFTIIRPSALYGERCVSRRVGQIFIENAIQGKDVEINGDGKEKLDFTYIDDLTEGISLACENERAKNEIFNITYGHAREIIDLLEILKSSFKDIKVNYKERDKLMPERGTLDNAKAKKILNFSPKYKIEDGYKEYIKWYKDFWKSMNK